MKKALAGMGALMLLATVGTACGNRKALDEAVSRSNAAATRAEDASRRAEAGVSRAEAACAHCAGMRK